MAQSWRHGPGARPLVHLPRLCRLAAALCGATGLLALLTLTVLNGARSSGPLAPDGSAFHIRWRRSGRESDAAALDGPLAAALADELLLRRSTGGPLPLDITSEAVAVPVASGLIPSLASALGPDKAAPLLPLSALSNRELPTTWPLECVRLDQPASKAEAAAPAAREARARWQARFDALTGAHPRAGTSRSNLTLPPKASRIAILSTWRPTACGLATFAFELRQSMLELGYSVDVIRIMPTPAAAGGSPVGAKRLLNDDHEVVFVVLKESMRSYIDAARFINERGYDFLFLQAEYGIFYPEAAEGDYMLQLLSRISQTVVVTTLHTILDKAAWRNEEVFVETCRLSDAVVSMSAAGCNVTEGVIANHQRPPAAGGARWAPACGFVPHGVPDLPFCDTKAPLKRALGFKPADFLLLSSGLLAPSKGIGYLIAAMPAVLRAAPHVKLLVAGRSHPDVGPGYMRELEAQVDSLGLRGSVVFHAGHLASAELHRINAAADAALFLHLDSRQRSSGTLIMAMAAGTVPISTPFAQAAELLGPGDRGVLVPFRSVETIASAVLRLVQSPDVTQHMRLVAYQDMRERTWASVGARYLALAERSRAERRAAVHVASRSVTPAADLETATVGAADPDPNASPTTATELEARPDRQLPAPAYFPAPDRLLNRNTATYASIDNGVIAIEASRPTTEWNSFRTGIHVRRRSPLGRSDYVLLSGCRFEYTARGLQHETRVFDENMVFNLIDGPEDATRPRTGTIREQQPLFHGAPAEGGAGDAAAGIVAIAQRDVTIAAGSSTVRVEYTLFLHDSASVGRLSGMRLTIGVDQMAWMNSFVRWIAVGVVPAATADSDRRSKSEDSEAADRDATEEVMPVSNTAAGSEWENLRQISFYYTSVFDEDDACTYRLRMRFPSWPAQYARVHRDESGRFNYLQVTNDLSSLELNSTSESVRPWGPWTVLYTAASVPLPGSQSLEVPERCHRVLPPDADVGPTVQLLAVEGGSAAAQAAAREDIL